MKNQRDNLIQFQFIS